MGREVTELGVVQCALRREETFSKQQVDDHIGRLEKYVC